MTIPLGVADLLRYLLLALVWTLAGRGLLCAAGRTAFSATGWLLAPAVTQAFLAVTLGMSAVLGTPIRHVSGALWGTLVGLATIGLAVEWNRRARQNREPVYDGVLAVLTIAVAMPVIVLLPYFVHGFGAYQGSAHPDAWSYTAFATYLWDYPRFTDGGLSPVHQWASHLSVTRYVAASELGWLATATHEGDTQAAFGLLLTLSTFTIGTACAAFGRVLGLANGLLVLAAVAGGAGNWISNAVLVSNLDNLLALPFLPALAAVASDAKQLAYPGTACIAGLFAAAVLYTYPEFGALCLLCSSLFFIRPLLTLPHRRAIISIGMCALTLGVLVSPYAADLVSFLRLQLGAGISTVPPRPGEGAFSGLVDSTHRLVAFWGLGASGTPSWPRLTHALALGLTILAIVGFLRMVQLRALAGLVTFILFFTAFSLFVFKYRYSYGAYKFVLLGWWPLTLAVVLGVRECSRVHPLLMAGAALVASATFVVSAARSIREVDITRPPDMHDFRELRAVEVLAGGTPIAIAVADNTAEHWAAYFLRRSKTRLIVYSGYLAMPHVYPAMMRAESPPWADLRLLLTDATDDGPIVEQQRGWKRLWHNKRYALWDTGGIGWAVAWRIDDPPPHTVGGNRVWVGDTPTKLVVTASTDGIATIHATIDTSEVLPGSLRFFTTNGSDARCAWIVSNSDVSLLWQVRPGDNNLTLFKKGPLEAEGVVADQQPSSMLALSTPTLEFQRTEPGASFACRPE
jgi:hypothetical protein